MLIIKVREGEPIDRALRRYKKKTRDVNLLKDVRKKSYFEKPSQKKKAMIQKARYRQHLMDHLNG